MEKGDTLQKKETGSRGRGFSLAATAALSSMTTSFADLKHVHNLWLDYITLNCFFNTLYFSLSEYIPPPPRPVGFTGGGGG
jgi:hypothetical protein